jgi:putative flippase GtrA
MIINKILKFSSVGALGSVTNITIFSTLVFLNIHYNIASVIAFMFAVTQNYTLNKKWTFKDHNTKTKQKFIKYFILNFSSFFINLAVLNLIVINFDDTNITKIIGQVAGIAVAMGFNFIGSYLVIFAKPKKEDNKI